MFLPLLFWLYGARYKIKVSVSFFDVLALVLPFESSFLTGL
jgi:hypothetical protein